jgi:hypothetical protein
MREVPGGINRFGERNRIAVLVRYALGNRVEKDVHQLHDAVL